jgi:hypothetical protein
MTTSTGGGWAQLRQQARGLETQVLSNPYWGLESIKNLTFFPDA